MAVTQDYQFDLDGFTFGAGTSTSVVSLSGLDMPEIDVSFNSAGNRHGGTTAGRYLKDRTIGMNGRVNGTYATFPALRDALVRAFRPRNTDGNVTFTFRNSDGQGNKIIYVKPQNLRGSLDAIATAVGVWDFNATLVAEDPRIYSETQTTTNMSTPGSAAQTPSNAGNFEAPTTITFTGPLTNPQITNSTTGKTFKLLMTLTAGQVVTVKSLDTTVYLGSSTSQYSKIDPSNKTFIELAPGTNSLTFSASSGTGTASVSWRSTWI